MPKDKIIFDLINEEKTRQIEGIELIASENFTSDNVMKATVPDIPVGPGGIKKGKKAIDIFNKIAKNRAKQNKAIQKSLEAKGYTFIKSKKK